ncbi:NADH dehydrogenase [ubiquinone] iron-sulfur protein 5-A [Platanthera guangdongensis]|uniref:NADH dehydrogenase [ubiquinone] iron-sulfur protein 5-A n=1 Tax=Platanthera guangdongensis TaxID=2320717 RepID=A0ABR2LU99_9ASPA
MASGWGIAGNKGRCYDFWMDFSECMSHCREPKDCALLREDYLECLHHAKEWSQIAIKGNGYPYDRRAEEEDDHCDYMKISPEEL